MHFLKFAVTLPPSGVQSIVMSVSVCLSISTDISQRPHVQTSEIEYSYDHGSVGLLLGDSALHCIHFRFCGCLRSPADLSPLATVNALIHCRWLWTSYTLFAFTSTSTHKCILCRKGHWGKGCYPRLLCLF